MKQKRNSKDKRTPDGWARSKFRMQKIGAGKRNILFQFTFEEWVNWWVVNLGPDWLELRGKGPSQFCMGRIGDVGPYHPTNVLCITNSVNSKMAREGEIQTPEQRMKNSLANRGAGNGRAKLDEQRVIEIYKANDTISNLARRYNVSRPVIKGIKTGKSWAHVSKA